MKKIAVFASGHGTNFDAIHQAILDGKLQAKVELLVVDNLKAEVVHKGLNRGVETLVLTPKMFASKADYEKHILDVCVSKGIEYIVLAGYMRLITDVLLNAYPNRIINIHPALLPNFKGKDGIGQAYRAGVSHMGVTIHYVDAGMDTGCIIVQRGFDVDPSWSQDECESRIHAIEHELYPETLQKLWEEI